MPLSPSSSSSSSKGTEQDTTNNSSNSISNGFSSFLYSPRSPSSVSTLSPESDSTAVVRSHHGWKCSAHGSVCLVGKRREMEDAVTVAPGFCPEYDFFGVYDGHGGKEVAVACRERMHVVLAGEVQRRGAVGASEMGWREVMEECFMKVDGEVTGRAKEGSAAEKTVGSTAVVVVVGMDRIVVANCGDCRAVLCRGGIAVPLSSDHKPDRPDELKRVEDAGGRVIDWDGYRVLGVLATSRSIGDQYLKPFVTPEPEVTVTERTEGDEFLVLASDGLWDVVSSETACYLTRKCLNGWMAAVPPDCSSGSGASAAAAALAELALSRGSSDNISVVVVVL